MHSEAGGPQHVALDGENTCQRSNGPCRRCHVRPSGATAALGSIKFATCNAVDSDALVRIVVHVPRAEQQPESEFHGARAE